jgi:cell division protein FtsZ
MIIKNTKPILLLISSHIIEITIDEIGEINDYIQEKARNKAEIIMLVSEDENLGAALAVTIFL